MQMVCVLLQYLHSPQGSVAHWDRLPHDCSLNSGAKVTAAGRQGCVRKNVAICSLGFPLWPLTTPMTREGNKVLLL